MYIIKQNKMRGLEELLNNNNLNFFIIDCSKKKLLFELFGYDSVLHISRFTAIARNFPLNGRLFVCFFKAVDFFNFYTTIITNIIYSRFLTVYSVSFNGFLLNLGILDTTLSVNTLFINLFYINIIYIYAIVFLMLQFFNSFANTYIYCLKKC